MEIIIHKVRILLDSNLVIIQVLFKVEVFKVAVTSQRAVIMEVTVCLEEEVSKVEDTLDQVVSKVVDTPEVVVMVHQVTVGEVTMEGIITMQDEQLRSESIQQAPGQVPE